MRPLLLALLAACSAPDALVLPLASRHADRSADLEELNLGAAALWEHRVDTPWSVSWEAGAFSNSFGDLAPYSAAGLWRSAGVYSGGASKSVSFGLLAGLAWYQQADLGEEPSHSLVPLVGPAVELALGPVRPRIGFVPDVGQLGGWLLTLQLRIDL